jgi:hypothetical protein
MNFYENFAKGIGIAVVTIIVVFATVFFLDFRGASSNDGMIAGAVASVVMLVLMFLILRRKA